MVIKPLLAGHDLKLRLKGDLFTLYGDMDALEAALKAYPHTEGLVLYRGIGIGMVGYEERERPYPVFRDERNALWDYLVAQPIGCTLEGWHDASYQGQSTADLPEAK